MSLGDPSELLRDISTQPMQDSLTHISSSESRPAAFAECLQYSEPRLEGCVESSLPTETSLNDLPEQAYPVLHSRIYSLGDFVGTDAIIPTLACLGDPSDGMLGDHCLEIREPDFRDGVRSGLAVVVAGKAFGCGPSREEAARALKGLGVKCVVANSFSYTFLRNLRTIGLLAIGVDSEDFFSVAAHGEQIAIDLDRRRVDIGDMSWTFALGDIERNLVSAGGLGVALLGLGEELFQTPGTSKVVKDDEGLESRPKFKSEYGALTAWDSLFACSLDDLSW